MSSPDRVVGATGIWGPVLAAEAGLRLPMVAVQHPYLLTKELPGLDDTPIDAPIVRYPEHTVYIRRHGRRYGLGSYAHTPLPLTPSATLASVELPLLERPEGPRGGAGPLPGHLRGALSPVGHPEGRPVQSMRAHRSSVVAWRRRTDLYPVGLISIV
ncbi:hypothetical protein [Streptomyces coeruleorubidus]|uniref:hypothetical protein n=1 Tax=Streptomyces coeruleorubidus TaxID=116188 RepID=UPI0037BB6C5C